MSDHIPERLDEAELQEMNPITSMNLDSALDTLDGSLRIPLTDEQISAYNAQQSKKTARLLSPTPGSGNLFAAAASVSQPLSDFNAFLQHSSVSGNRFESSPGYMPPTKKRNINQSPIRVYDPQCVKIAYDYPENVMSNTERALTARRSNMLSALEAFSANDIYHCGNREVTLSTGSILSIPPHMQVAIRACGHVFGGVPPVTLTEGLFSLMRFAADVINYGDDLEATYTDTIKREVNRFHDLGLSPFFKSLSCLVIMKSPTGIPSSQTPFTEQMGQEILQLLSFQYPDMHISLLFLDFVRNDTALTVDRIPKPMKLTIELVDYVDNFAKGNKTLDSAEVNLNILNVFISSSTVIDTSAGEIPVSEVIATTAPPPLPRFADLGSNVGHRSTSTQMSVSLPSAVASVSPLLAVTTVPLYLPPSGFVNQPPSTVGLAFALHHLHPPPHQMSQTDPHALQLLMQSSTGQAQLTRDTTEFRESFKRLEEGMTAVLSTQSDIKSLQTLMKNVFDYQLLILDKIQNLEKVVSFMQTSIGSNDLQLRTLFNQVFQQPSPVGVLLPQAIRPQLTPTPPPPVATAGMPPAYSTPGLLSKEAVIEHLSGYPTNNIPFEMLATEIEAITLNTTVYTPVSMLRKDVLEKAEARRRLLERLRVL